MRSVDAHHGQSETVTFGDHGRRREDLDLELVDAARLEGIGRFAGYLIAIRFIALLNFSCLFCGQDF